MNKNTKKLVVSAVMLALATVLSLIKIEMPFGGSITPFSMLPIIVVGYMYGTGWGLLTAFTYSLLQMLLGVVFDPKTFLALEGWNFFFMVVLDYVVAFTVLGLGGVFRKCCKNGLVALLLGAALVILLRFAAHWASGAILWGSYAEWFFTDSAFTAVAPELCSSIMNSYSGTGLACIYSLVYNSCYMIPELIIHLVGCAVIYAVKPLREFIAGKAAN